MIFLYRLFFPLAFLFFLPGLIWKLIKRSGHKKTYWERFSIFSAERRKKLEQMHGCVWFHAVSVGETNLALTTLREWVQRRPDLKFVLSTTTTTAQEIARMKVPDGVEVIFCPIDSSIFVGRTLNLLKPSMMVIFETELWPNLVLMSKKRGVRLALVNARISDKSAKGYRRVKGFFAPILEAFDTICVQTELDRERLEAVSGKLADKLTVTGNIKFDQQPPSKPGFPYAEAFGEGDYLTILAASTHPPEEKLILNSFLEVRKSCPDIRLAIVPRHAERGDEIERWIKESGLTSHRRSRKQPYAGPVECLLADTTGELTSFIKSADLVIMGKTLAGNTEGQNIIEPALMGKAILCGHELKNFRQALDLLVRKNAVRRVSEDSELTSALKQLLTDKPERERLGHAAAEAIAESRGALEKTIEHLEKLS